jgi:hypothetical protein
LASNYSVDFKQKLAQKKYFYQYIENVLVSSYNVFEIQNVLVILRRSLVRHPISQASRK